MGHCFAIHCRMGVDEFGALLASCMSMQQRIAELSQGAVAKCRRYRRVYEEDNWPVGKGTFGKARNATQTQAYLGCYQFGSTEVAFC